jgi:hypothetical protein
MNTFSKYLMKECLRRRRKPRPRMSFRKQQEELRYLFLKRRRRSSDTQRTLTLRTQAQSPMLRDGSLNGRDPDSRSTQRRRDSTSKVLKEMPRLTQMYLEELARAQLIRKQSQRRTSTREEREADDKKLLILISKNTYN